MANVCLITPWQNAWVPYFKEEIESRGHNFIWAEKAIPRGMDVYLHGWASMDHAGPPVDGARNVYFLRRFEYFGPMWDIDWSQVDALICVNEWMQDRVKRNFLRSGIRCPVHLVYNTAHPDRWTYKEREPGNKIGMACHVHPKKNIPLALQVLQKLTENYELHIAGEVQDPSVAEYLDHMGIASRRKVYLYGHVPHEQLNMWWESMHYCLSTSVSEGCPNNVIEAALKGIKPLVHQWPGAKEQWGPYTFRTGNQAAAMIKHEPYHSSRHREWVERMFPFSLIKSAMDIALGE
jgi:glycosyltransferase involved in cell wall biosynthesis